MMATAVMDGAVMDGAVDVAMVSANDRQKCEQLGIVLSELPDDFPQQCFCALRYGRSNCSLTTDTALRLSADDQILTDEFSAMASNGTDTDNTDTPEDNLINSDVFIYVIVFIVIVYFLTFLYLCMKKRQREAEDAESGGSGVARPRASRNTEHDRPPPYEEVMGSSGAVGGKSAEPPTYAEVLARSQQLDQLDKAEQGAAS